MNSFFVFPAGGSQDGTSAYPLSKEAAAWAPPVKRARPTYRFFMPYYFDTLFCD
jgi:hypothetical protein